MAARQHFVRRRHDGRGLGLVQQAEQVVHHRAGALDLHQGPDDLPGLPLARDVEVLQRALRLRAPEALGGDRDGPEGVVFDAGGHAAR